MKKLPHFLIVLLGGAAAVVLAWFFTIIYEVLARLILSADNKTVTLYKVLTEINYERVGTIFIIVVIYMLIMDFIVTLVARSWRRVKAESEQSSRSRLSRYWFSYRSIHIVFILLTIFVTLSMTAPAMVMNSFTAIVSISVLVTNLTKKIGHDE